MKFEVVTAFQTVKFGDTSHRDHGAVDVIYPKPVDAIANDFRN